MCQNELQIEMDGRLVWFAWVTSLLISLLPFILMIIAKKVSFMKTIFFKGLLYASVETHTVLFFFFSALPRVGLLSLQLLQLYVKHVLVSWPSERAGPWPCSICIHVPRQVPSHISLSKVYFSLCCTSRWGENRMEKGKVKTQSLLE